MPLQAHAFRLITISRLVACQAIDAKHIHNDSFRFVWCEAKDKHNYDPANGVRRQRLCWRKQWTQPADWFHRRIGDGDGDRIRTSDCRGARWRAWWCIPHRAPTIGSLAIAAPPISRLLRLIGKFAHQREIRERSLISANTGAWCGFSRRASSYWAVCIRKPCVTLLFAWSWDEIIVVYSS